MTALRLIALRLVRDDIPTPAPTSPARGPAGGSVPPPSASASQPVAAMSAASPAGTSDESTSSGLVGRLSAEPIPEAGGGIHSDKLREQRVRDEERNAR